MRAAVISGIGSWLPPDLVTNDDLAARMDTSDEWIRTRTGIRTRHFVSAGMPTSRLAAEAGARAMESAGTADLDAVVLATTTPDRPCPASAPEVARRLGLTGRPAFDVSAVCTGFLYALTTAAGMIASEAADQVLVIGAEAFSTLIDPQDRSSAVVFGDGAGAVVLRAGEPGEPGALGRIVLGSDGSLADLITVRAGGSEQPHPDADPERSDPADRYFSMRGREVFGHAVTRMSESARAALAPTGWQPGDVDRLVGHQANLRILRAVAEQLDIPADRLVIHLDRVGNTAAASIPLALAHAHATGELTPGARVVLAAFGGGATWGATALTWPSLKSA
ncbi:MULTISPECIES: beta-ketoacyl-ACP synthase III [unclassified Streptomyces]|uniref:beta-ketoacyl-ACP synthase III n=1 Tax=unclassified Streptomyces TaxID=2593676 RepID=UPI0022596ADD|nr:beta-ketoacyl-ACP synthase III [Streptomyces sp. NBC_00620]MCX4974736.1 ketoacyl-ACP synthase III [Streptomyces sp. NBC_00620]WUC52428.1 ketoacyl-ACP synthase III [Streptomyces sp. NBC_00554]